MLTHDHKDTEESMFAKRNLLLLALLCAAGVGLWWTQRPEPVDETEAKSEEGDTGFSREAVEERMRAIGYVQ